MQNNFDSLNISQELINDIQSNIPINMQNPVLDNYMGDINNKIDSEPNNISGWGLIGKVFIGLIVGGFIVALIFVVLSFLGNMFSDSMQTQGVGYKSNPLIHIMLLFIGFLATFIGNMIIAGVYSLFYGKRYYNFGKMAGFILLSNAMLFFVLAPVYMIFSKQIDMLFVVLGFHVLFAIFVSANQIDFLSNPNYSGSAMMGNVLGFAMSILVYGFMYKLSTVSSSQQQTYLLMLLPAILGYTLIPFFAGIWEKIYYKFYEMGSNAFYIQSLSEVQEVEELSLGDKQKGDDEEINVDL